MHPGACEIVVLDKDNNPIKGVKTYNTRTKEALCYAFDMNGMIAGFYNAAAEWVPKTEIRILEGSRLALKSGLDDLEKGVVYKEVSYEQIIAFLMSRERKSENEEEPSLEDLDWRGTVLDK